MQKKQLARAALMTFTAAALLGVGYIAGTHRATATGSAGTHRSTATGSAGTHRSTATGSAATAMASATGDKTDPKTGRKVLYWHDPMVPNQHFDKPGKSPFMNMQLEPVYADEGGSSGIRVDAGLQQNLGIRYATVRRQDTAESFDAVGTTQFDESMADVVQSRATGYIDHLYTSAPMQRVAKGAPIASLFVPDWLAPQEEYLALKRGGMDNGMLAASRARMRAMSIPEGVIASLDRTGKAQTHITLSAPETGVLTELNVRDGAMVSPGQTLAKVAGLGRLWLIVEVPEALALQVRPGMTVDAVKAKLAELKRSLPPGVEVVTTYDRSQLIERAVDNLKDKLIEEFIIVGLVCAVFLFHLRSAFVAILSLPRSDSLRSRVSPRNSAS